MMEGEIIYQQCCQSPTSFVIRNRLLVFTHSDQFTLVLIMFATNQVSLKTWIQIQFELYLIELSCNGGKLKLIFGCVEFYSKQVS